MDVDDVNDLALIPEHSYSGDPGSGTALCFDPILYKARS